MAEPDINELLENFRKVSATQVLTSESINKLSVNTDKLSTNTEKLSNGTENLDKNIMVLAAEMVKVTNSLGGLTDVMREKETKGRKDLRESTGDVDNADDTDRAKEQNKQAIDELQGAKESKQKEEDKKAIEEERKTMRELLVTQKESTEVQLTANDYLRQLASMTERNTKLMEDQRAGKRTEDETFAGMLVGTMKTMLSSGSDVLAGSLQGGASAAGSSGGLFRGSANIVEGLSGFGSLITGGIGGLYEQTAGGGFSSYLRQRKLGSTERQMNAEKASLSAQQAKLERMKSEGADKADIVNQLKTIRDKKRSIRDIGDDYGSLFAEESMYQRGKRDKEFRNLSEDERSDIQDQVGMNFYSQSTSDLKWVGRKSKTSSTPQIDGFGMQSISGNNAGTGNLINTKSIATSIMDHPVASTNNPATYGQFIGGLFEQLRKLNRYIVDEQSLEMNGIQGESSDNASESGGGFGGGLMKLLGGLLVGGVGAFALQQLLKKFGIGDAKAGGDTSDDVAIKAATTTTAAIKPLASSIKVASEGGKDIGALSKLTKITKVPGATKALGALGKSKFIPGIGLGASGLLAAQRLSDGDKTGASLEMASGIASMFGPPGVIASTGINTALVVRDVMKENSEHESYMNQLTEMDNTARKTISDKIRKGVGNYGKYLSSTERASVADAYLNGSMTMDDIRSKMSNPQQQSSGNINISDDYASTSGSQQKIGLNTSGGMNSGDTQSNLTMMEIQARLIAVEMMKIQKNPDYIAQQETYYKKQGYATAEALA